VNGSVSWWEPALLDRERWGALVQPALDRVEEARRQGGVPPQLLLVGPPGLGRELVAVELAALLTCPLGAGPYCDCGSCDRARRGRHPDVVRIAILEKKTQILVEQIREVVESAPGRPFEGVRRVWLLDGVEAGRLGEQAANAFLKTLEEPPAHASFVLLAANPFAVLPTVRSRCQQLHLPGAVAVAGGLEMAGAPPELAVAVAAGEPVGEMAARVRGALEAGRAGSARPLLHLARALADEPRAFEVPAAVALELGVGLADGEAGEELVRLADELLATARRTRALNHVRERQLLACLLRWQREC
jgi:DNA polymerase-3 subunit delta'